MKLTAPLIYGLIACILLVSAPHAGHLPLWVSAICSALLAWRAYLTWNGNPLPARWLLLVVTFACVLAIAATFHTLFGREVGVTLLILLATLKLLEIRAVRDVTVLIYLSCFIIITNFFYSQSIPTALFMLVTLLVIMATWVHMQTGDLAFKPRLRIAGILLLQAIPLSLIIFVLFPRVQGPLWGMPQDAYASSGLSDSMAPGSLSRLSLSDAVAFRVVFNGKAPPSDQMYWRGPVLWDFDGTSWKRGRNATLLRPVLTDATTPVDYTVTLEAHNKPWLFVLDMPAKISIPADLAPDFQVLSRTPVNARTRYSATSLLSYRANLGEPPQQLQRALALPQGYNPQARKLAAEWRTRSDSDMALVRTALDYFNRNGFEYSLEPPLLGTDSVDDFIFTTKKGFCEHYAGSFVFLMRAAGLPSRVVTGYQGGEYNNLGGYYILRQYDAHAWAEVWLRERGWVRIDPTAAIAPARIQSGLNAALPNNATLPFLARTQSPLLLKLRFNLDALTNQWNQWVLGYNTERQFAFLTRLGMEDITWKKLAVNMLSGVALLVGIFTLIMLRRLSAHPADAVQAIWLKACRKLEKAGLPRAPHEGAMDYAARIAAARPELSEDIHDLAARYASLRYGGEAGKDGLAAFGNAVRAFKL
ncbi:protein-glutamine gamma-glutamyltransferase [mine drainage metagenome]|uniref:Protein-glutamine gamma-glutamyltransferase n=1 Tax=mine drainage metagenome TaxID=410659 RepID=A0A1J5S0H5_9ZZZZ